MKIVINTSPGGFAISKKAAEFMAERGSIVASEEVLKHNITLGSSWDGNGITSSNVHGYDRTDPLLIQAVEELKNEANFYSTLKVIDIPDDVEWVIKEDDDGSESIHEKHRIWR